MSICITRSVRFLPTFPPRSVAGERHSDIFKLPATSRAICRRQIFFASLFLKSGQLETMEIIMVAALILGVLLSFLFVFPRFSKSSQAKGAVSNHNSKTFSKASRRYNKAEISLHKKRTDCWIIIKDKVYDVSSYVEEHPGGDAILNHAGDDSTEGFFGPQHGTRVFDIIEDFCIGDLEQ